jgi:NYN domain
VELHELGRIQLLKSLGLDPTCFGNTVSFIDFANVNRWFDSDRIDLEGNPLAYGAKVEPDLIKLHAFTHLIGKDARFYYGLDTASSGSLAFIKAAQHVFGSHRVFTKPIQQIRHDLGPTDSIANTRIVHTDRSGNYVFIPKCNFDIEIAVDAMRLIESYDTLCLFSGDADFVALLRYLKGKGKKIILIKGGRIKRELGMAADIKIEAAQIRSHIAYIKRKPG